MDFSGLIYITTGASGWLATVAIKVILNIILRREGKLSPRYLLTSGGIPSVHTSFVSSVVLVIGLTEGFQTPLFGLGLILLGVVIYDAMGVRKATETNTAAIKDILQRLEPGYDQSQLSLHLAKGHSFYQILVGLLVGIVCGIGNYILFAPEQVVPA